AGRAPAVLRALWKPDGLRNRPPPGRDRPPCRHPRRSGGLPARGARPCGRAAVVVRPARYAAAPPPWRRLTDGRLASRLTRPSLSLHSPDGWSPAGGGLERVLTNFRYGFPLLFRWFFVPWADQGEAHLATRLHPAPWSNSEGRQS